MNRKYHAWNPANTPLGEVEAQVCARCGIKRYRRDSVKITGYRPILLRGVWEDKPVYHYGKSWWYGPDHKFSRPNCK